MFIYNNIKMDRQVARNELTKNELKHHVSVDKKNKNKNISKKRFSKEINKTDYYDE
jgi:hypothetical protein